MWHRGFYIVCTAIMLVVVLTGSGVGAWQCCTSANECGNVALLCCDPDVLEPCYDTWWPFDQIDGYCMTLEQCVALVN